MEAKPDKEGMQAKIAQFPGCRSTGAETGSQRNALFDTGLMPLVRMARAAQSAADVDPEEAEETARQVNLAEARKTSKSIFFSDDGVFELLRLHILPQLIERRRTERRLRIWSAGSSTGQEAYSLAMMLCEHFPLLDDWDVQVIGTDVSGQVLDYAERGQYRQAEVKRGLSARLLEKYFVRDGDLWRVSPKLRSICRFWYAKLCGSLPEMPLFDLILLRNVLLYMAERDRGCVFQDLYRQISPHGFLVMGDAEQAEDSTDLFTAEYAGNFHFYRPAARAGRSRKPFR